MKNKLLIGLIAGATVSGAVMAPTISSNLTHDKVINKTLLVNQSKENSNVYGSSSVIQAKGNSIANVTNNENSKTNEAVVVKGNSTMNLYALSNGTGLVSKLSTGEMLTVLGRPQGNYCKVWVQETKDMGYINIANMKSIINGTNAIFNPMSERGQVVNVSTRLRLRTGPLINNNVIWYLTNGEQFSILGKQGQWYKIDVNGQIGFIYEEYVSTNISNNSNNTSNSIASVNSQSSINANNNTIRNVNSGNNVKNVIVKTKRLNGSQVSSSQVKNNSQGNINSKNQNTDHIDNIMPLGAHGCIINVPKGKTINILNSPNGSKVVGTVSDSAKIDVINPGNGWDYIKYKNLYGYVPSKNVKILWNNVGNTQSNNSNGTNENGKIEIIKPNSMFGLNTIIVKNGTGKAISNSQLVSVMKYWILNGQYDCFGVYCADGTMWAPQWFKTVSDSQLISAFINANGKEALSKNITANELLKAAESLSTIVYKGKEPFSLEQATTYIKEMLAQSYPGETITKIVPVQGGYYVYTTPFNKSPNNKWPFWVVNAYTGYAHG